MTEDNVFCVCKIVFLIHKDVEAEAALEGGGE